MRRLPPKGAEPQDLHNFRRTYPTCRDWDFFYNNFSSSYQEIKKTIFSQQGGICAYCEAGIPENNSTQQRIEHFHPKSHNDPQHNWTFDWNNMLGVCTGTEQDGGKKNMHCDSSKERYVTKDKCEGYLLNPLTMPYECLFDIKHDTGELTPNEEACSHAIVSDNAYSSVSELVRNTIRILNLNCDTLNQKRRRVILEYEKQRKNRRQNPNANTNSIRTAIARMWFEEKTPSFYTTRRILLGGYAERIIQAQRNIGAQP